MVHERVAGDRRCAAAVVESEAAECIAVDLVEMRLRLAPRQATVAVRVEIISTSEIRISVLVRADALDEAVRAIHTAFDLDDDEDTATVYAGTGR